MIVVFISTPLDFLWFNCENCPEAVWFSWRKRSVSISIPIHLNGSCSASTFSHRSAIS